MKLNKACGAPKGHTKFLTKRTVMPVIVSAKRFEGIMSRSRMDEKHNKLAEKEEEKRYLQYLKDGHEARYKLFTNVGKKSLDEEKQAKLDQELKEAEIREKQVRKEDEQLRKERIMRANRILESMKPSQRALFSARLESDITYQRKYNEALNREIAEEGRRQQVLDELQCPETLIPLSNITEEELAAAEKKRAIVIRADFLKDIEERRLRKLAEKEDELNDQIIERAQYQCLQEQEEKKAKEIAEAKREFCRRAYREALQEKAQIKKFNQIVDTIDDRVLCVDAGKRRRLERCSHKGNSDFYAKLVRDREARGARVFQLQQENARKIQYNMEEVVDRYQVEVEIDEHRRQCEKEMLAKQRQAYQMEERKQAEKQRRRNAQIRRFEVAERLKGQEANKKFYASKRRQKDKETANLRKLLFGQHEEAIQRRQEEALRISACPEDVHLKEDVKFFKDAVQIMGQAQKTGRPVYPIARAVNTYRRKNPIDAAPETRMVRRKQLRDYCWPGYHAKADLAFKNYEQRDKCREEEEQDRHDIVANSIKINKMAAGEHPYKPCILECPIKCFHHRGMPAIEDVGPFDCAGVDYEDSPLPASCPDGIQVIKPCKASVQLKVKSSESQCLYEETVPDPKESALEINQSALSSKNQLSTVPSSLGTKRPCKPANPNSRPRVWR